MAALRILIVAEHASARFGGEAILPLHWFRLLAARGVPVRMVVHERTREELAAACPELLDRVHFVRDTRLHRLLWRAATWLPRRLGESTLGVLLRLLTQSRARTVARALVRAGEVDLVHQPIPVSPKDPSLLRGLGVPVVIGPMNGGMQYPPAFRRLESGLQRLLVGALRRAAGAVHMLLRGKREAATLLVANARTAAALPSGCRGRVVELVENGVDFATFDLGRYAAAKAARAPGGLRLVFVGRLVDWKALDVVLDALARLGGEVAATLDVVGDGPMRAAWVARAAALGLQERVRFLGFRPQTEVPALLAGADVLVLPSVYECGGAVVLEAMAMGVVVVATAWGGPLDYLDASCGILVPPASREALVAGFADALRRLAREPATLAQLAEAAARRCRARFDWQHKVDTMREIYAEAYTRHARLAGRGEEPRGSPGG